MKRRGFVKILGGLFGLSVAPAVAPAVAKLPAVGESLSAVDIYPSNYGSSQREQLADLIYNISPMDTPFTTTSTASVGDEWVVADE